LLTVASNTAEFRTACSKFPTGVTIATVTASNGIPYGMSISSFTSVSLDPLLVLVCIDYRAQMIKLLSEGIYIGINVLGEDQQALSEKFAKNWHERFAGVQWHAGVTGVPLLADVLATFECKIQSRVPAGDHLTVIAEVLHVRSTDRNPLVYVNRSYARVAVDGNCLRNAGHPPAAAPPRSSRLNELAQQLCEIGRSFHHRGWAPGTGGNYSMVLEQSPLRLAITASGADKGRMLPAEVLVINEAGEVLEGQGHPSYESLIHVAVARSRRAGAVLHTHSLWGTILSQRYAADGGFSMEGLEMLKGLEGIKSHNHCEWVPILANSQDIPELGAAVEQLLHRHPEVHGFLLAGHGLYTWGDSASQALRHVDVFEFLFEVLGRDGPWPRSGKIWNGSVENQLWR